MEIAASAHQQSKLPGEDRQAADLLGRLMAIDHFDGMAPCLNIVGYQAAALAAGEIVVPGMRQADPGAARPAVSRPSPRVSASAA